MGQSRIFRVLNFRENGQNLRNSQKFLLVKVSAPKLGVLMTQTLSLPTNQFHVEKNQKFI